VTYIVQPGDSLYLIALKFHTTVEDIMAANGITDPALTYPGQVINIPVAAIMHGNGSEYIVQPGENLDMAAKKHGVRARDLIRSNNIKAPYIIYPGQTILVPGKQHPSAKNEQAAPLGI